MAWHAVEDHAMMQHDDGSDDDIEVEASDSDFKVRNYFPLGSSRAMCCGRNTDRVASVRCQAI